MENIDGIKKTVETLIYTEESKLKVLKQIQLLLNADELKAGYNFNGILPLSSGNSSHDSEFDSHKKLIDKVDYVITKTGRVLNSTEVIQLIQEKEVHLSKKAKNSLSGTLNSLIIKGRLIGFKYNNDKKLAFYGKPEWFYYNSIDKSLKEEYSPSPLALAGTEPERLKPELISWSPNCKFIINQ